MAEKDIEFDIKTGEEIDHEELEQDEEANVLSEPDYGSEGSSEEHD